MKGLPAMCMGLFAVSPGWSQRIDPHMLARVAEEADALQQNAPRCLTVETLRQRSVMPPARFRPRAGSAAEQASGPRQRDREVVSEYSFGALRHSSSQNLIEFRQVVSVDGRVLQSPETAQAALSQSMQAPDDRFRKRMLENFADNGLVDIATDYGLILLAFTKRGLERLELAPLPGGYVGTNLALAFSWKQKSTDEGALEFRGGQAVRHPLEGTLWVRASDGRPLRVAAGMEYTDDVPRRIRDEATVDYVMSPHGFLTPASVIHRHQVDGRTMTENLYRYEPFRLFNTSSTIKFADDALSGTEPPPTKK